MKHPKKCYGEQEFCRPREHFTSTFSFSQYYCSVDYLAVFGSTQHLPTTSRRCWISWPFDRYPTWVFRLFTDIPSPHRLPFQPFVIEYNMHIQDIDILSQCIQRQHMTPRLSGRSQYMGDLYFVEKVSGYLSYDVLYNHGSV